MRMCELVMRFEAVTPGKTMMTGIESAVFDRSPTGSIDLFSGAPGQRLGYMLERVFVDLWGI
jgi:hypothetical protein